VTSSFREQTDPWAVKIIDLETVHQAVTDAIVREVDALCTSAQQGPPPLTLPARLLLGPPGVGKTHLFARLRRLVQQRQHRVSLVYIRPSPSAPQTSRMLLAQIFEQLRLNIGERPQIDLLLGAILALVGGTRHRFPNMYLTELGDLPPARRADFLDMALERLLEQNPALESSATYLEVLLRVPFIEKRERRAWLSWLEGRESDDLTSQRFKLPPALTEDQILPALRALATVAAPASPLLLVFDQLENLVDHDNQEARIKAYARLVMELVDTVPGLVLLQMAVDSDWNQSIAPHIDGAPRSRLSLDATSSRRQILALPTAEQRRQLVELWRQELDPRPTLPFPWPFSSPRMEALCELPGLTPRMLLQYFQEALASGDEEPESSASSPTPEQLRQLQAAALDESLSSAWRDGLVDARQKLFLADEEEREVENSEILDGLLGLALLDPALKLSRDPNETEREVQESTSGRRIALVRSSNGRSTAAHLQRVSTRKHRKTPLLALRERWRPIPDSWAKVLDLRKELEKKKILQWRWLEREEAAALLALNTFLMALRSHDVNGPDGKPVPQEEALAWLRNLPEPPLARLLSWLQSGEEIPDGSAVTPVPAPVASGKDAPSPGPTPGAPQVSPRPPPVAPSGAVSVPLNTASETAAAPATAPSSTASSATASSAASPVAAVSPVEVAMARLRVASLDRLVRELRGEKVWRRAEVRKAVEDSGGRLRLLGSSLVVAREEVLP
jgi:hypothetical protein